MADLPGVRVTADAIYFDGEKLPGVLARGGVTVTPGGGLDLNKLTVTFLVAGVECEGLSDG